MPCWVPPGVLINALVRVVSDVFALRSFQTPSPVVRLAGLEALAVLPVDGSRDSGGRLRGVPADPGRLLLPPSSGWFSPGRSRGASPVGLPWVSEIFRSTVSCFHRNREGGGGGAEVA